MNVRRCASAFLLVIVLMAGVSTVGVAQSSPSTERMRGVERLVLRLNVGISGEDDTHLGMDADFGLTDRTSFVTAVRRWGYESYGCIWPGPVMTEDGSMPPPPDLPPCEPQGWSASAGVRGQLWIAFGEVDMGVYRYDQGQAFVAPYGGVRAGLAPGLWPGAELQIGVHLITVSSYSRRRFDFAAWKLGSWDLGLGIQLR